MRAELHPPFPPVSPASSSSIECVESMVASRIKIINEQTSRELDKCKTQGVNAERSMMKDHNRKSQVSTGEKGVNLLNDQRDEGNDRPVVLDDKGAWPVLVAVRCRPRIRQRAERRFGAESSSYGYKSSSSNSGDEEGSDCRSSDSVQRGVFEYSACREYNYTATNDTQLSKPQRRRPRRLYVQTPSHTTRGTSGRRSFDFDYILPPWLKQKEVYNKCVHAQISHVLELYEQGQQQHTTILAYGQTGTGKTYTMGMLSEFTNDSERGIIPRALSQILDFAANTKSEGEKKVVITLSFLQIYLETVQDLFAVSKTAYPSRKARSFNVSSTDLPVRQGRDGAFYVNGLNEYEISSIDDAHALLELAMRNRVLAATMKNKTSSRSHTLLTISIRRDRSEMRSRDSTVKDEDEESEESDFIEEETEASTISFVDLAGSERVDGALHFLRATRMRQEQRIREAKFINRSLSALGGVIAALAQPKTGGSTSARLNPTTTGIKAQVPVGNDPGEPHIRFRDSQLTKLLQGRLLCGRGRLLLIATVDDQPKNLSETLSTLKFAVQCRRVELQPGSKLRGDRNSSLQRQKALVNQIFKDMKRLHENREAVLHGEYQARIEVLEGELEAVRAAAQMSPFTTMDDVAPIQLASYTALCSLVDTICSVGVNQHRNSVKHPRISDFSSEKEMLEYVAGLYSQLKEMFTAQQAEDQENPPTSTRLKTTARNQHHTRQPVKIETQDDEIPQKQVVKPLLVTADAKFKRTRSRILLSSEQEAEFRAIARHLIATHALDSIVVSSSDEDTAT